MPYKRNRVDEREKVRVAFDQDDLRSVRVYTLDFRFICEARLNERGVAGQAAITREHLATAMRQKAERKKATAITRRHVEREYLSTAELAAREANRDPTPAVEAPLKVIQTPLDGASKQAERRPMKKAAGAESDPLPSPADLLKRYSQPIERKYNFGKANELLMKRFGPVTDDDYDDSPKDFSTFWKERDVDVK